MPEIRDNDPDNRRNGPDKGDMADGEPAPRDLVADAGQHDQNLPQHQRPEGQPDRPVQPLQDQQDIFPPHRALTA